VGKKLWWFFLIENSKCMYMFSFFKPMKNCPSKCSIRSFQGPLTSNFKKIPFIKKIIMVFADCKFICFLNFLLLVNGYFHVLNIFPFVTTFSKHYFVKFLFLKIKMTFVSNENLVFESLPHDLLILIFWHIIGLST
jgi:hypothetical protein